MPSDPIYLDGYSTNPLAPESRDAMIEALGRPGNPTSPHRDGAIAARIVANARRNVADLIGASPAEIVFTSGATEANNLAITGLARQAVARGNRRRHLAISAVEHKSVLEPAQALAQAGFRIDIIPVDRTGRVDQEAVGRLVTDDTLLVSVMAANNETGVLQPVADIARISHAAGALMHCDAAQAGGKIPVDVLAWDVDYLSLSGHKLYGPMGVGALFVAAGAPPPTPLLVGGGQQKGLRAGTEPTPLLAGFGAAARIAAERLDQDQAHGRALAERLLDALGQRQLRFYRTTGEAETLPGSLSLSIDGVEGDYLVQRVADKISLSTGSACTSGQVLPSHVLRAMNIAESEIMSVIRIFCGRYNTEADIDLAAATIADECARLLLAPGELRQ